MNVFYTLRGVSFAIRLLGTGELTIHSLNLHPDIGRFIERSTGLVLVCGPTGSGKSSTLAALIQEINNRETRHIITVESPIEFIFQPKRSFIRQREVGRDTPSFDQALLDALREDPDVLMVGEMRERQTIMMTLNASETGHLVLSTIHSANCVEALQRVVASFPADIQGNIAAQLADCLVGVVAQRLRFDEAANQLFPECEILVPNSGIRNNIRQREFFKISTALSTGAEDGNWTFDRYRRWMSSRTGSGSFTRNATASRGTPSSPAEEPEKTSGPRIEIGPFDGSLDGLLRKPR